ncbi:MAG: hypothetical protein AAB352_02075 [Patescibacteria group bacterium]
MVLSNFLAEVFGFSFVAVSLSLLINPKNIKKLFLSAEDDACLFYGALVAFVAGITIVLSHNIWGYKWQVVITILGWLSLIKGALILLWPDLAKDIISRFKDKEWISPALVAVVFAGLALIYAGFSF